MQLPPLRTAGFLIRTVAYLVDAFLLGLVGGAFPFLVISSNQSSQGRAAGSGAGAVLLSLVYFVLLWSHLGGGRTLGMRLFGLKVVGGDGRPIGVLAAIGRWIGLWLSFVVCFLGVIWVAFDSLHQGWHDKLSGTYVVHV
ncbi:MAG TPA: RDD family protein [Candidatus Acidoferrales bacterium]|nr:RDD family protein [Candidatus Acidoferrales bacterium]